MASTVAASRAVNDLFSVHGKVVLVTGGSGGIGLMIAEGFVKAGARVYITSRKAAVCEREARRLTAAGPGSCDFVAADISKAEGCEAVVEYLRSKKEDKLHVLVNNAGCNWGAPLEEFPDHAWDKVLALNVKSVFKLTVGCLPLLEAAASAADPARVINIGSINGLAVPTLEVYSYTASKAAVHHLSKALAWQLSSRHITVNAVAPGSFPSKMMKATLERFGDMIVDSVPLKRIGEPADMAGIALYLASKAGAYVTGAVIPVDGGALIRAQL